MEPIIPKESVYDDLGAFTRKIRFRNYFGFTSCSRYFYNYDHTYVSSIANHIREIFPDSTVVIDRDTICGVIIRGLSNYTSITVTSKTI